MASITSAFARSDLELVGRLQSVVEIILVVRTETVPRSAAAVPYVRGKVGPIVGRPTDADKTVLLFIAPARGVNIKIDRFPPPCPQTRVLYTYFLL